MNNMLLIPLLGSLVVASQLWANEKSVAEKSIQPIRGAFGLMLGESFDPAMVKQVISREEKVLKKRGKGQYRAVLYQVQPAHVSPDFDRYSLYTTMQGAIYQIRGEKFNAGDEKACKKLTGKLAADLEELYGKPRGKGMHGEWYSFRDMTAEDYRGVRLYANRCNAGYYLVEYSDDGVKNATLSPANPENTSLKKIPDRTR